MLALALAVAIAPWSHPLAFGKLAGWRTGASGNVRSVYVGRGSGATLMSTAWIARGVTYRDAATADPPNVTLAHLSKKAVIVWAVITGPASKEQPIRLSLAAAKHVPCCDAVGIVGGTDELHGSARRGAYSVIVRIYYGSVPTTAMRAAAAKALARLELPPVRR